MALWVRHSVPTLVATAIAVASLGLARLPELSSTERDALAARFRFERRTLGSPGLQGRTTRHVHPAYTHISGWISSVGASLALEDIDDNGQTNDACHVDPRTDAVTILPMPGTAAAYAAFDLIPPSITSPVVAPMGCRLADLNDDGLVDVLVYFWGRTPLVYLRRALAGPSASPLSAGDYVAVDVAPGGGRWNSNAAVVADIDGDGRLDLVIANYFPDGAVMLDPRSEAPAMMQNSMARSYNGGLKHILLNVRSTAGATPGIEFRDLADAFPPQISGGWTLAVGATDLDDDQRPEIYFANDFGPDRLLHNRSTPGRVAFALLSGRKTFRTPTSMVLGRDSFKGMGVDFGDVNGDGRTDLYVSNIANEYALQESHFVFIAAGDPHRMQDGWAPFVEASERLGLSRSAFSWEARLADYDNDGVPEAQQAVGFVRGPVDRWPELQELAMGNNLTIENPAHWPRFDSSGDISGHVHNPFFVRSRSGRYFDLAANVGIGHPQVARGIAIGDVDNDGDLDFAVARQWEPSDFYRNDSPAAGRSLTLRLLVPALAREGAWRPALGATVRTVRPDGVPLIAHVDGGSGHSGGRAAEVHLGLADTPANTALDVQVTWRDGSGRVHRESLSLVVDAAGADGRPVRRYLVRLTPGALIAEGIRAAHP
jgi:hypothetical protein